MPSAAWRAAVPPLRRGARHVLQAAPPPLHCRRMRTPGLCVRYTAHASRMVGADTRCVRHAGTRRARGETCTALPALPSEVYCAQFNPMARGPTASNECKRHIPHTSMKIIWLVLPFRSSASCFSVRLSLRCLAALVQAIKAAGGSWRQCSRMASLRQIAAGAYTCVGLHLAQQPPTHCLA